MLEYSSSILVTGGQGQLGQALRRALGANAMFMGRAELDITNPTQIRAALAAHRPAAVINCAAYTQVDKAEVEAERCFAVNATAVKSLAEACKEADCTLVQISTDYVFGNAESDAKVPWRESDPPSPNSVYAHSKCAGELAAQACERHFIVRTCGLYGGGPAHVSFVEKMLELAQKLPRLRIVSDQQCTPSFVDDVATAIAFLLTTDRFGTYHIVNGGSTTWYDFAAETFRIAKVPIELVPISTEEFGAPAERPRYSVLSTKKYEALGGPVLRSWQEALADYLLRQRALRIAESHQR